MLGALSAHYVTSFGYGWSKRPADMEGSCECMLNTKTVTDGVVWSVTLQSMSKIFTLKHICNVYVRIEILWLCFIEGVKVKLNQSHYRTEVPRGCRKLRFPDCVTVAQDGGKVVSLTHRPLFTARKYSRHSFLLEAESTRRAIVRSEILCQ